MRTVFLQKGLTKPNSTYQNFTLFCLPHSPSPSDKGYFKPHRFLQVFCIFLLFPANTNRTPKENRRKKSGGFAILKTRLNYFSVLFSATFMFSNSSIRLTSVGCSLATYSCSKVLMRCSMRASCFAKSPLVLSCAIFSSSNR